jgi:phosphoribosyl-AMP cyclohydrolase
MINFDKAGGLVPAVAQDADTGEVLMLAWMNREAFEETVRTGRAVYFSRSRNRLRQIGGAACHEGYKSCFFRKLDGGELAVVGERVFDPKTVYGPKAHG